MKQSETEMISINVGAEYDGVALERLRANLKKLHARRKGIFWGVGGFQEMSNQEFIIYKKIILIEVEAYIGIIVSEPAYIVKQIENYI